MGLRVASQMKTSEVVAKVIQPCTECLRCRYVELPQMTSDNTVGCAEVFVSHTWGAPFADTVAAIAHALPDAARVWLDIFAVRQWPGNGADLSFRNVVRNTNALLLCAVHVPAIAEMNKDDAMVRRVPEEAKRICAFFRVWCLVELQAALHAGKPVVMLIGAAETNGSFKANTEMCQNLYFCVDVRQAVASVETDRKRILREVEDSNGGVDALNKQARGAINGAWETMGHPAVIAAGCGFPQALFSSCLPKEGEPSEECAARLGVVLRAASASGTTAAVVELLEAGAALDATDNKYGSTALMEAASSGHEVVLRLLLKSGAALDATSNQGWTALMHAAEGGHEGALRMLLEAGAEPNAADDNGWTALMYAAEGGHEGALSVLLEAGAVLHATSNDGVTALRWAELNEHDGAVRVLQEAGGKSAELET
eukprot:gene13797-16308_t